MKTDRKIITLCVSVLAGFGLSFMVPLEEARADQACGTQNACKTGLGEYRIALSQAKRAENGVTGAVIFLHGWQGTARAQMRNKKLIKSLGERGVAYVAPQGLKKSWSFQGAPGQRRDDVAFLNSVAEDIVEKFSVPRDKIIFSGFSLGGSMAWTVACREGNSYAAYAPIAGAFWRPHPEHCTGEAVTLLHVHGTSDRTVPMKGRPIGEKWHQGDVRESIALLHSEGQCVADEAKQSTYKTLSCERQMCGGGAVELCLHKGGHSVRGEWVVRAWDEISKLKDW